MTYAPLINLENVCVKLPYIERIILDQINFKIFPGECVMLLGGNGSGKSSLIKVLDRSLEAYEGNICFIDHHLKTIKKSFFSKWVVSLSQDSTLSLFYDMTVIENCILWGSRSQVFSWYNFSTKKERQFYNEYLHDFHSHLPYHLDTKVKFLSGGEKQALLLALSIQNPPKLLLLDEHTAALDPTQANLVMEATIRAQKENNISCIITTHNLDHALEYGDRLIAIKGGNIVFMADKVQKQKLTKDQLLKFCY